MLLSLFSFVAILDPLLLYHQVYYTSSCNTLIPFLVRDILCCFLFHCLCFGYIFLWLFFCVLFVIWDFLRFCFERGIPLCDIWTDCFFFVRYLDSYLLYGFIVAMDCNCFFVLLCNLLGFRSRNVLTFIKVLQKSRVQEIHLTLLFDSLSICL